MLVIISKQELYLFPVYRSLFLFTLLSRIYSYENFKKNKS